MQSVMMHSAFCMPRLVTREEWLFYGWCMCVAIENAPKITLKKRVTHLFLAALVFAAELGLSLAVVRALPVASHRGAQALGHRLSSCGTRA